MFKSQVTYYKIILGGGGWVKAMMTIIIWGRGVQNEAKFDYVICARSLIYILLDHITPLSSPIPHHRTHLHPCRLLFVIKVSSPLYVMTL